MEYTACEKHRPRHKGCPAVAMQGWLKRKGYAASQYQGMITTDAPRNIMHWAFGWVDDKKGF